MLRPCNQRHRNKKLEVHDIPTPTAPAPGHVLLDMDASAINHGDKTFLRMPTAAGKALALGGMTSGVHRSHVPYSTCLILPDHVRVFAAATSVCRMPST